MKYSYNTKGTCSTKIDFEIEDNRLHNVSFTSGCNGNLKAISKLVEGEKVDDVINKLSGIKCGFKNTSCGDQLAKALESVKEKQCSRKLKTIIT